MYQNLTKDLTKEEMLKWIMEMNRETLINVLEWNDPNGIYNDEDSEGEGLSPITKKEAIEIIIRQFEL